LTFGGGQNFNAAGFAKFADTLKSVAKGAEEVATQLRTGKGYGEVFSETINKIPIVGQFKQAGEAIGELITGQKAARIEAEKLADHAMRMAEAYRSIGRDRAAFGKYGEERATIDIDNSANAAKDKLEADKYENNKKLIELKRHDAYVGWYTAAQKAEMKRLQDEKRKLTDLQAHEDEKAEQAKKDLRRQNQQAQHEFMKALEDQTEEVEAKMQEKSLKRQGKALESAIVGIKAMQKRKIDDLRDSVSDFHLEGMNPEQAAKRKAEVAKAIISIQKDSDQTLADLKDVMHRKEFEQQKANDERMKQVQASANIERLKMQDEATNLKNQKNGTATRSHLADIAQIEEDFRKQSAELAKRNREEHGSERIVFDDDFKGQLKALRAERQAKLDLLGQKSGDEAKKNQEDSIKEQRKLWEQVGGPAEKYKAHLAEINEHFEKYHDLNLKNSELKKLDKDTLEDFKKLNPGHETKVGLYGRTQSYAGVTVGDNGESIAKQQLELAKKAATQGDQNSRYWRDIWDYFRRASGVVAEFTI
jgi:hypothetical protein